MRLRPGLVVATTLLAIAGCRDSLGPARALIGQWETAPVTIGAGMTNRLTYRFDTDGRFAMRSSVYGGSGALPGVETAYYVTEGTYLVDCGRLYLRGERWLSWDIATGAGSPPPPQPTGSPMETVDHCQGGMEFVRLGDMLVFTYLSYPADAAVETRMVLTRVR